MPEPPEYRPSWRAGSSPRPGPWGRSGPARGVVMVDLSVEVDGIKFPNPFVIGSGPPGSNAGCINRAFKDGWGGVVCKTISLDSSKVTNTAPRYAKLWLGDREDKSSVFGFENIELISDRPFADWLVDFKKV